MLSAKKYGGKYRRKQKEKLSELSQCLWGIDNNRLPTLKSPQCVRSWTRNEKIGGDQDRLDLCPHECSFLVRKAMTP